MFWRDKMASNWFPASSRVYWVVPILEFIIRNSGDGRFIAKSEPELIENSRRLPIIVDMEFKFPGFAEAYDASRRDIGRLRGADTTSGNVGPFHKPVAFQHRLCGVLGSFACRSGLLDASAVREPPAEYRRGAGKEGLPVIEQLPQSGVIGAHARPFYLLGSPRPELDSPPPSPVSAFRCRLVMLRRWQGLAAPAPA